MTKTQMQRGKEGIPTTTNVPQRLSGKTLEWMQAGGLTREFDPKAAVKSLLESATFEIAKQVWFGLSRKDPNEKQRTDVINGLLKTDNGALPKETAVKIAEHIDSSATAREIAGILACMEGKLNGAAGTLAPMLSRATRTRISAELQGYVEVTEGYQQSQLSTAARIFGSA